MTRPSTELHPLWVFGIGFHKTGTSSLGKAFERLHYRVAGPFGIHEHEHVPDLPAGDGWAELCDFLGTEVIREPFVHANSAQRRNSYCRRTVNWCKQAHRRIATQREPATVTQAS